MSTGTLTMDKRWYIVHAYSNFEKKVAESIREQAKQRGLEDLFEQVLVPTEKVTEVRRGRKIDAERKFFPGYVLVKMKLPLLKLLVAMGIQLDRGNATLVLAKTW